MKICSLIFKCLSFGVSFQQMKEMGLSYIDDSGHEFVTGECRCDLDGLGKVIIDTLVSGLSRLDDILCGVLVTTFETILDAGLVALPVGQIKRLETFIRAAKTVAENGLDAGVFFGSWANPICGKGWDKPSEDHVFAELAQAPHEYGSSLGCKRMEGCPESHNQRRGLDKDVRGLFGKGGGRKGGGKSGSGKPGDKNGSNPKNESKPADKPTDKPKSDDKPKSTTKEEPKSTTKDKPTTTEEKPKETTTNKPNSTTRDKPTTKTNDAPTTTSRPKSATSTHSKPTSDSETHPISPTTSHSRSTSKDGNAGTSSTIKPGPTTTDRPGVSSTSSHKSSSTKHSSTQVSSTTTQGRPTTSPICKPGKGVGGCSACSNVQAWPPGYFKDEDRGEEDDEEVSHLAIRGTGFFGWESHSLERRAKKSTTSTSTPSSTSGSLTATSSTSTQTSIPPPPVFKPSKNGKKVQFCDLVTNTAPYPGPAKLIGNKNVGTNVIFALKNPKECGDFEIRRRLNSLYKTDYKMLNSPKHDPNYGLATEHVLETQLISLFSEEISKQAGKRFIDPSDKSGSKMVDFCTYMTAYWADSNKNFLPEIGGVSKLGVQWIADQFPITKSWVDEFFLLPGAPNGIKGRAWGNDKIFVDDMKNSVNNRDFLTKNMLQESELVKAIIRFKDVMFAYKYMAMKDVGTVFNKQVQRISNILTELDEATANIKFEKKSTTVFHDYVPQGLGKQWDKWIKERTEATIKKTEMFFDDQYGHYTKARAELEKELKAAIKSAEDEEKKNKSKKLNAQQLKDADAKKKEHEARKERYETVIKYLQNLEKSYTSMKKWKNPL
ncbi:TPA_exp: Uncharacterized protein A8136_3006 [Trichophyton benhamiae CBS 112371]|nr:TPA_exp: Uncharacterized protein A8136_3006 [Trichophyton benhamiae CBS 112371]